MSDIATRDAGGKYLKGHNQPGPGNPYAGAVSRLRKQLLECVRPEDVPNLYQRLMDLTKSENQRVAVTALQLAFDRLLGRPDTNVSVDVSTSQDRPKIDLDQYSPAEQEQIRQTLEMVATRQLPS